MKLPHLDEWNAKRREHAEKYNAGIVNSDIVKPICIDENTHIYYTYVITTENAKGLREYLKENDISSGVYFPVPLHLQKVFEDLGYKKGDMPNAEYLAECSLAIPMFAELTEEEVEKVIACINAWEN